MNFSISFQTVSFPISLRTSWRMPEQMMKLALPAFFSGLAVQSGTAVLAQMPSAESEAKPSEEKNKPDTIPDDEIPWDYLGE